MPFSIIDDLIDIFETFGELLGDGAGDTVAESVSETPVEVGSGGEVQFSGSGCICGLNPNTCGSGPFCKFGA